MDLATMLGIVSAFGLVMYAIFSGSGLGIFINIPSAMIVVGGTIGVTLVSYPLGDVMGVMKVIMNAFFVKTKGAAGLIPTLVEYASSARRDGILALESVVSDSGDPFLQKGIQLAVDGLEPRSISTILETEIQYIQSRHKLGADIFTTMGTFSPAMGLIGTLIGLVQMLQNLSDPGSIGPAMAVALITTFYGAMLANLVFLPIAGKLKTRSKEEILSKEVIMEGVLSITAGDNPRVLEQKLHAYLAPAERQSVLS